MPSAHEANLSIDMLDRIDRGRVLEDMLMILRGFPYTYVLSE